MSREKTARPMGPHGGHGPMGARMGEKSKDFGGTMKKLIAYMRPYYASICIAITLSVASVILMIMGPKILAKATDELIAGFTRLVQNTGGIDVYKRQDCR